MLFNELRHLLRLQFLLIGIIVEEPLEKRKELSVVFGFHGISNGFNLWVIEGARANFSLENGDILLSLRFKEIDFFLNQLGTVGEVLTCQVLNEVRNEDGHDISELNFVEFFY